MEEIKTPVSSRTIASARASYFEGSVAQEGPINTSAFLDQLSPISQSSDMEFRDIQDTLNVFWLPVRTTRDRVKCLVLAYRHPAQLDTEVFVPFFTQVYIKSYVMIQHESLNGAFHTFSLLEFDKQYKLDAELLQVAGVIPQLGEPLEWATTAKAMLETGLAHHNLSSIYMRWLNNNELRLCNLLAHPYTVEQVRWRAMMFLKNKFTEHEMKNARLFIKKYQEYTRYGTCCPKPDVSNQDPTIQNWFRAYWDPCSRKKALWIYGDPKLGSSIWIKGCPENNVDPLIHPEYVVFCKGEISMNAFIPNMTRLVVIEDGRLHTRKPQTLHTIQFLFQAQSFTYDGGRGLKKDIDGNYCTIILSDIQAFMEFHRKYHDRTDIMSKIVPFHLRYKMYEGYHPQEDIESSISSQASAFQPELDLQIRSSYLREEESRYLSQNMYSFTPQHKYQRSRKDIQNHRHPQTEFKSNSVNRPARKNLAYTQPYSTIGPSMKPWEWENPNN